MFGDIVDTSEWEVSVPWRSSSVVEQRAAFVALVSAGGVSFAGVCARFGISRQTGYKWLRRWAEEGREGLVDRSRRPYRSPAKTGERVAELVCQVREANPSWGGRKIRAYLLRREATAPAASTITAILRRRGLLPAARPGPDPAPGSFRAPEPNAMWQIDFKGDFGLGDGTRCYPLGILDDYSRFNLGLHAAANQRTTTVKDQLVAAFDTYGLPEVVLADNGPPWGTSTSHWRHTALTVWLLDRGIRVVHSRPLHPQTLGKEERFHQTLNRDLLTTTGQWPTLVTVQDAFDWWRIVYNYDRPHEALNNATPADHYQPSPRLLPATIEPPTYPDDWQVRIVTSDARITINHTRYKIGKPFIGKPVAIPPPNPDGTTTIVYRTHPIRLINMSTMSPNTRKPSPRS